MHSKIIQFLQPIVLSRTIRTPLCLHFYFFNSTRSSSPKIMPNNHRDGNNSLEDVRGFNGRAGRGADHGGNRGGNYQGRRGVHRGGKDTGMPRRGIDHGPNRGGNYHGSSGAQREARGGAVALRPGRGNNGNFGGGRGYGGNSRGLGDRPASGYRGGGRGLGDSRTFHGKKKEVIVEKCASIPLDGSTSHVPDGKTALFLLPARM